MFQKTQQFMLIALLLAACTQNQETASVIKPENSQETESTKEIKIAEKTEQSSEQEDLSFAELLQGRWQSTEDNSNYLIFEKGLRKEIAAGMKVWDEEPYELSNHCLNESDAEKIQDADEEMAYITCKQSDMCWNIVSIDKENLSLSYVGRGNTLNYKRSN